MAACTEVDRLYERVPIGTPHINCKCYVVDANLNRLPPFIPGELLIAGRGVGRGYLNRPDVTEKVYIRNPFSNDPAFARAYRTGDVVRLLPDGNIDFIRERKPAYMVPAVTMQIDSIPLNQNSKVNKRALPKPEPKIHAEAAGTGGAVQVMPIRNSEIQ